MESFEEAKKLYESIAPIRGKRLAENIRPVGERRYWWEEIVKVSRNEYAITNEGWTWRHKRKEIKDSNRLSFKRNGEIVVYGESYAIGTYDLIQRFLPQGVWLTRYDGKLYLTLADGNGGQYFRMQKKGLRLRLVDDKWQVLNPVPEPKYKVERPVREQVLAKLRPFQKYVAALWDMIDADTAMNTSFRLGPYSLLWCSVTDVKNLCNKSSWYDGLLAVKRTVLQSRWDIAQQKSIYIDQPLSKFNWANVERPLLKAHKNKFIVGKRPLGFAYPKHMLERA